MVAVDSAGRRVGVGTILIGVSLGLWAITFAWMRIPYYVFHSEGQLYALFPIAVLAEAAVVILAVIGLVFAIVGAARRLVGGRQTVLSLVVGVLMLTVGPVLMWFGTVPL